MPAVWLCELLLDGSRSSRSVRPSSACLVGGEPAVGEAVRAGPPEQVTARNACRWRCVATRRADNGCSPRSASMRNTQLACLARPRTACPSGALFTTRRPSPQHTPPRPAGPLSEPRRRRGSDNGPAREGGFWSVARLVVNSAPRQTSCPGGVFDFERNSLESLNSV